MNTTAQRTLTVLAAAAMATAMVATTASPAAACGGFFCNSGTPVSQVGERILFAVEGNQIEAHIQIAYQGPAESFSWILPMPSVPTVAVGTDELFTQLHFRTDPRFMVDFQFDESCDYDENCMYAFDDADGEASPSAGGGDRSVQVVDSGAVGPYAYEVIESADGEALFDWLIANGYDVPSMSKGLIGHYADIEFKFLGLKLLKDKEAGDIQPVVLNYEADSFACIPLQLTAIAAQADMPVYTWVLAEARAIPLNFFHVLLDPKSIDWLSCAAPISPWGDTWWGDSCAAQYREAATEAVDGANGHGFMTEFAGPSTIMDQALWWEDRFDIEALKNINDPASFMQEMLWQGFPRNMMVQEIIRTFIPKPDDSDLPYDCQGDNQFYATWNIANCMPYMDPQWEFDAAGMANELEARIAHPLREAQQLFSDHGYLSRLFSTVSPEDMTKDPLFSFNPDLPDVSNEHSVTAYVSCEPAEDGTWQQPANVTVTYPNGDTSEAAGQLWQCGGFTADEAMDTAGGLAEVQIMDEEGAPQTVPLDEVEAADAALDLLYPADGQSLVIRDPSRNVEPIPNTGTFGPPAYAEPDVPSTGPTQTIVPSQAVDAGSPTGGCQGGGTSGLLWVLALALLAAFTRRERLGLN